MLGLTTRPRRQEACGRATGEGQGTGPPAPPYFKCAGAPTYKERIGPFGAAQPRRELAGRWCAVAAVPTGSDPGGSARRGNAAHTLPRLHKHLTDGWNEILLD